MHSFLLNNELKIKTPLDYIHDNLNNITEQHENSTKHKGIRICNVMCETLIAKKIMLSFDRLKTGFILFKLNKDLFSFNCEIDLLS